MTDNHHFSGWSRRQILKSGLALGGSLAVIGNTGNVLAQSGRAKTLAIAAPATPLSLDVENSLSLGTIDTVAAFYDDSIWIPVSYTNSALSNGFNSPLPRCLALWTN
jgi:hypothetical protein